MVKFEVPVSHGSVHWINIWSSFILEAIHSRPLLQPTTLYADYAQIYVFCRPGATSSLESCMSVCFSAIADWMSSNRLQLNATKTEILCCTSMRWQHQLPTNQLTVVSDQITPVMSVRSFHIYINTNLAMWTRPLNYCQLLWWTSSYKKYLTVYYTASVKVAHGYFIAFMSRLW